MNVITNDNHTYPISPSVERNEDVIYGLEHFPTDLLLKISALLDLKALTAFSEISKSFYKLSFQSPYWEKLCNRSEILLFEGIGPYRLLFFGALGTENKNAILEKAKILFPLNPKEACKIFSVLEEDKKLGDKAFDSRVNCIIKALRKGEEKVVDLNDRCLQRLTSANASSKQKLHAAIYKNYKSLHFKSWQESYQILYDVLNDEDVKDKYNIRAKLYIAVYSFNHACKQANCTSYKIFNYEIVDTILKEVCDSLDASALDKAIAGYYRVAINIEGKVDSLTSDQQAKLITNIICNGSATIVHKTYCFIYAAKLMLSEAVKCFDYEEIDDYLKYAVECLPPGEACEDAKLYRAILGIENKSVDLNCDEAQELFDSIDKRQLSAKMKFTFSLYEGKNGVYNVCNKKNDESADKVLASILNNEALKEDQERAKLFRCILSICKKVVSLNEITLQEYLLELNEKNSFNAEEKKHLDFCMGMMVFASRISAELYPSSSLERPEGMQKIYSKQN